MSNGPFNSNQVWTLGTGVQIVPDGGNPAVHDSLLTMAAAASGGRVPFHVTAAFKYATTGTNQVVICPDGDPTSICVRHPPNSGALPQQMTVFAADGTMTESVTQQQAADAIAEQADGTERGYWVLRRDDGMFVTIEVPITPP